MLKIRNNIKSSRMGSSWKGLQSLLLLLQNYVFPFRSFALQCCMHHSLHILHYYSGQKSFIAKRLLNESFHRCDDQVMEKKKWQTLMHFPPLLSLDPWKDIREEDQGRKEKGKNSKCRDEPRKKLACHAGIEDKKKRSLLPLIRYENWDWSKGDQRSE